MSFLSLKVKEIIVWMLGFVLRFCFFSCLKRGNRGEKGVESTIFYDFFNSTYPEISKKIGFRDSPFRFPPSLLRVGRKKIMNQP